MSRIRNIVVDFEAGERTRREVRTRRLAILGTVSGIVGAATGVAALIVTLSRG